MRSVHIPYDQQLRPYHVLLAELVHKHTPAGGVVIDYACGVGNLSRAISIGRSDIAVVGVDIDQRCIELSKGKVPEGEFYTVDQWNRRNNEALADVVVMAHCLEHFPDPGITLEKISAQLKDGGLYVIAVPNIVRFRVWLSNLLRRPYVNKGHLYAWDREHFEQFLVRRAGLSVRYWKTDYLELPLLSKVSLFMPVARLLARAFPRLSFSLICVCERK